MQRHDLHMHHPQNVEDVISTVSNAKGCPPPNTEANTEACCSIWRHHLKSQLSVHYDLDTPFPKKFDCTIITFDWPLLCFHITNKMQSVCFSALFSCFTTSWKIPLDGLWFKALLYSLKCYGVCLGHYKGNFMPNIFWCFFLFVLSFFLWINFKLDGCLIWGVDQEASCTSDWNLYGPVFVHD